MSFESERSNLELEAVTETARSVLKEREYNDHEKHELLVQFLTSAKIKPVSSIGFNNESRDLHIQTAKKLGLDYSILPPNDRGYSEMVMSKDQDLLNKFQAIGNISKNQDKVGELLGYTPNAIKEFLAQTGNRPAKFWQDIVAKKHIPDELILAWKVADMIPASYDDAQAIEFGKKIKDFLNKINPVMTKEWLEKGRKNIINDAQEAIEAWKI